MTVAGSGNDGRSSVPDESFSWNCSTSITVSGAEACSSRLIPLLCSSAIHSGGIPWRT
jgi:hypothetical protein